MAEEQIHLEGVYTYTYDQFTVFFYENHVFIGGKEYPIGQCCVDIVNLNEAVLKEIDQRVRDYIPAAQALLTEKTDSAAALAQEKLNAVWDVVFSLPVYRDLNMDDPCNCQALQRLMADEEKWAQVQDSASEGYAIYQGMLAGLTCFTNNLRRFRKQITGMTERYFVPMMHRTEPDMMFIAEKATFNSLTDFLRTEFYRGLAKGNAPRCCHNCGRYFLLTAGYNTCYCNNIAPGETTRTCRKVGAHRKEAQGKENQTPAQKEYARTYNRLKARKQRGKISRDEWNKAVAKAQELVAQSECGALTDAELKQKLGEF